MQSRKGKGSWFVDSAFTLFNASDFTKQVRLSLAALTTGILRTFSFPNTTTDVTLAHTGVDTQTFGGQLQLANGSLSAPTLAFNNNYGFFYDTTNVGLGVSVNGAQQGYWRNGALVVVRPATADSNISVGTTTLTMMSNSQPLLSLQSFSSSVPLFTMRRANGTIASPTIAALNDQLGQFQAYAYTVTGSSSGFTPSSSLLFTLVETGTVSPTAVGGRITLQTVPIGSGTMTEIARFESGTGLSMFGANPVIDQNRNHRLRSYTLATLPTSVESMLIGCSDTGGGTSELRGDGTGWERMGNGGYQTLSNTTSFTWTSLTNAANVRLTGAIAADQTVTLATTNARAGHWCIFTRTGTGAFNWSIGGLKNLALNTWCRVEFDGTAWFLASYGTL